MGLIGLHFEQSREILSSDREGLVNKWERDLWQMERTVPKLKFPIEIVQNFW